MAESAKKKVTVLSCGPWCAVYDSAGDRMFEAASHTSPTRTARKPVWLIMQDLGFDVAHHNLKPAPGVGDFPLHWPKGA